MNNPHNKKGVPLSFSKKDLLSVTNNTHFDTLMDWTEEMLKCTKTILSPQFFHPSFSERDKDIIVSMIYSCYEPVEDIERVGESGVVIRSSHLLNP